MGQLITPSQAIWEASDEALAVVVGNTPEHVLVNAGGEVIDRTPEELAAFISTGGVWVDYCGWPMVYIGRAGEELIHIGPRGFDRFLSARGIELSYSPYPELVYPEFIYPRSLVVLGKVPAALIVNKDAPYKEGDSYSIYSNFALLSWSGYYFYAYRDVDPVLYTNFITNTLARLNIANLLPMFPWEGPPLPRFLGILWPRR